MSFLAQDDYRIKAVQGPLDAPFNVWNTSSSAPLTFSYRFGTFDNQGWGFSNWSGLSAAEQNAMKSVMAEYASVANVKFVEVSSSQEADIDFGHVNLGWSGGQGGFNFSFTNNNGVITRSSEHYVVFSNGLDLTAGSSKNLMLHELGHAMTLKHPGNYDIGGGTPKGPFLPTSEDNNHNSVMSYHANPIDAEFSDHLMPYDIAALHARFGANMSFHTGNDVYTGPSGNLQTIWDAGGTDTIDGRSFASAVTIDLREGTFSSLGAKENLAIAFGAVIENASGGAGDDTLIGNQGNNRLDGRAGADRMEGRGGDDTYIVGNSRDIVIEAADEGTDRVLTSVSYKLGAGQSIQELSANGASLTTNISLTGNELAQTINGNAGANIINGGGGRDILWGGDGADTFVFDSKLSTSSNIDRIVDFSVKNDTIWLDHDVFTSLKAGALSAGAFEFGTHAKEANDRIIYDSSTGALFYDSNGSATGGATQFATLATGLSLTHNDFFIV